MYNALINKNFFLLWAGKVISQIGDKFHAIALAWWILQKTNSTAAMGFFMAASILPGLVLGTVSGALIDRFDRKSIIIISDILRGLCVIIVACLSIFGMLMLWQIFAAAAVISLASSFFDPAVQAVIPQIVEKEALPRANSLSQIVGGFTIVIGPLMGAACVSFFGFTLVFWINGISYLVSALFEGFMIIPSGGNSVVGKSSLWEEIKEGYGFLLKKTRVIIIIYVIGAAHFFVGSLTISLPFMANQLSGSSIQNLGNLEMILGLGMLIGSVYCNYTAGGLIKDNYLFLYLSIMGLCFLGIGTINCLSIISIIPYMLFMFFTGASIASASILWQSLLQVHTPNDLRGRVFSISAIIGNVTLPLSYGFFGVLLKYVEIKRVLIVCGLCLIIFCAVLLFNYSKQEKVAVS